MAEVITLTPHQQYLLTLEQYGAPLVPADPSLRFILMQPELRKPSSAGATINHLLYDDPGLDEIRGLQCPATGTDRWVFMMDPRDISQIHIDLDQGTGKRPRWLEVPWVHRPDDLRFPFPEKLRVFLRAHRVQLGVSGDPVGWRPATESEIGADAGVEDERLADQMAHFCRWLADQSVSRPGKGFEKLASSSIVSEIVEAAKSLSRWRESRAAMKAAARLSKYSYLIEDSTETSLESQEPDHQEVDTDEPPENLV